MTHPVPGFPVSTPYGKRGRHWSCNKDSAGLGVHTGLDIAAPSGTQVVAARGGVVRHTGYGAAFGTKQFAIVCADGTEDFYAHTTSRPVNGMKVATGAPVAKVGALGNVTGPHLHFERHKVAGRWNCDNHTNPSPSIDFKEGPTTVALWYEYSGKPKGSLRLPADGRYVRLDATIPTPPRSGEEHRLVYLNVVPTWKLPKSDPLYSFQTADIRVRWTRTGTTPDPTAYQDFTINAHRKEFLLTHVHWELGKKGLGGHWSFSLVGHATSALVGTRYSKGLAP